MEVRMKWGHVVFSYLTSEFEIYRRAPHQSGQDRNKPQRERGCVTLMGTDCHHNLPVLSVWLGLRQFQPYVIKPTHVKPLWEMTSSDRCIMGDFISIGHLVNFYKEEWLRAAENLWKNVVMADVANCPYRMFVDTWEPRPASKAT